MTDDDIARLVEVLRSGWLTHGSYNTRLETDFARYMGTRHAISMNSGTSALYLALVGLGIRGEVIMPSFTFVATANATVAAGATPVFVDIEYATCNVNPAAIEAAVTPRTEAIMPVHYGGQAADMGPIMDIARRRGLAVIEDSAETIGGDYRGKKAGTFGIGCFSFYPTKNMTTGEGGMITTEDDALADRVRMYISHGIPSTPAERHKTDKPWLRAAVLPGFNLRLSNIHAALGVGQLARLDAMNARRREHAAWYSERLAAHAELDLPVEAEGCRHVFQMYTVKLKGRDRAAFLAALHARGVGASVHFDPPVHLQPMYVGWERRFALPVTERVAASIVTLPLFPGMTAAQRQHVAASVTAALAES
ncbi:MAG: DegT/DnrJ/EryC1/StrS family aminotransferase [bacterium]